MCYKGSVICFFFYVKFYRSMMSEMVLIFDSGDRIGFVVRVCYVEWICNLMVLFVNGGVVVSVDLIRSVNCLFKLIIIVYGFWVWDMC